MKNETNFGFSKVLKEEKTQKVKDVFSSVSNRYDLMNDLMSVGFHRYWKKFAVDSCRLRENNMVLDLAGGTGDLTKLIVAKVGQENVFTSDININMLHQGRVNLIDKGINVPMVLCDAESIPFSPGTFDCVIVGFGIRNMTDKEKALHEIYRVLKWGGQAVVLEFSDVWQPIKKIYDAYSFKVLPYLGSKIAKDRDSYQYLAESIRMHPSKKDFSKIFKRVGFSVLDVSSLSLGIVAIHRGYKC